MSAGERRQVPSDNKSLIIIDNSLIIINNVNKNLIIINKSLMIIMS